MVDLAAAASAFAAQLVACDGCSWLLLIVGVLTLYCLVPASRGPANAPHPPVVSAGGVPFIGNFIAFTKPIGMIRDLYRKHGSVFTMNILGQRLTFMVGRDARCTFYRQRDDVFSQAEVYGFMTPVFGKGVVYDAPKKIRAQQMQFLANGLRTSSLKAHVGHIVKECNDYFTKFGDEGSMDLKKVLSELIILTSSRALMGDEVRETLHTEVAQLYADLDKGITPLSFFWPNAPVPGHWQRDRARKEMVKLFARVIKHRRAEEEAKKAAGGGAESEGDGASAKGKKGSDRQDVLGLLINSKYKDGSSVTDDQIVGLLIALLFAGQHTSSITSTWCSMFLLQNPDILRRVRDEQEQVLGGSNGNGNDGEINFETLGELELLHSCVKETLRHYPPLIMLMRKVMQTVEVPLGAAADAKSSSKAKTNKTVAAAAAAEEEPSAAKEEGAKVTIPKGDIVLTAPAFGRFDEDCFADSEKFDPDRYGTKADKDAEGARQEDKPPFAFVGFGGGMHACMGQQFAYLQLKTVLTVLFQNFDLEMAGPFPEPDYEAMVVGPKGNCPVRYKRRSKAKVANGGGGGGAGSSKATTTTKVSKASQASKAAGAGAAAKKQTKAKGTGKSGGPSFTAAEVGKHNRRDDAWIIVEGKVYDVTAFVEDHPGGDAILSTVGEDSTEGFLGEQHPPTVRDVLDAYYIGELA